MVQQTYPLLVSQVVIRGINFMNERFCIALKLRKDGKTFRQIGQELGISHGRASEIYHKAKNLEKSGKLPPKWTHGLRTKVAQALIDSGFKSKQEVINGIKSGQIKLIPRSGRSTIAGIGSQSLEEIAIWAGLASPEENAINHAIILLKSHGYSISREQ